MSGLFPIIQGWRRSLRRVQATKLIVLSCITGLLTGAATIAFVELLRLVQWVAIGSADLVQKFDSATLRGWRGALMRFDGLVGPDGSTPREWRLSFWNRRAARAALHKALAWDPQRVLIAHGEWVRENGRAVLARSLRWIG